MCASDDCGDVLRMGGRRGVGARRSDGGGFLAERTSLSYRFGLLVHPNCCCSLCRFVVRSCSVVQHYLLHSSLQFCMGPKPACRRPERRPTRALAGHSLAAVVRALSPLLPFHRLDRLHPDVDVATRRQDRPR